MKKIRNGFTLIELLIVIAIIGILASVVLVNLNSSRIKARYAKIYSEMQAINSAMSHCRLGGGSLLVPTNTVTGGGYICSTGSTANDPVWPDLTSAGMTYGVLSNGTSSQMYRFGVRKTTGAGASFAAAGGIFVACGDGSSTGLPAVAGGDPRLTFTGINACIKNGF